MSPRHFRWCLGKESEISAQAARAESADDGSDQSGTWPPQTAGGKVYEHRSPGALANFQKV